LTRIQARIDAGDLRPTGLRPLVEVMASGPADWDAALRSAAGEPSSVEPAAILGLAARARNALNQAVVLEWTLRQPPSPARETLEPVLAFWRTQMLEVHGVDVRQTELVQRWLEELNRQQSAQWDLLSDPRFVPTDPAEGTEGGARPGWMVWLWDANADGLTLQWTDRWDRAARDHVALATAWLRADPANPAALQNYVIAQFQRAKRLTGIDQPLPESVIDVAAEYLTAAEMAEMLRQALDRQHWTVAQALLESLARVGDSQLLQATAGRPSPVVKALHAADPRVRWVATQTILAWRPTRGFVGSSYFNHTLAELLGAPAGAAVVVASMNPYHADYLAALTRTVGHDVVVTYDAGQLFSEFSNYSPPFLVVTDALGEIPYLAVIDKIRTSPKGHSLPILLLVRPENLIAATKMLGVDRRDPQTLVAPFSEAGRDLLPLLEQISRRQAAVAPPNRVAIDHAQHALTLVNQWAADDKARQLLDYPQFAPAAQSVLGLHPQLDPAILELLSNYGNPETQWYLANLAGDTGRPVATQVAAATAFRASVKRFGTLLTSQQIAAQYERQNRSAQEAPLTQNILNSILDTLEARFRQTPFDALPPIAVSQDR
jgi:DNA-binding response OmpR family regulator